MGNCQTLSARNLVAFIASILLAGCATVNEPGPAPKASVAPAAIQAPCPACPTCPTGAGEAKQPAAKPMQRAKWTDLPGWAEDDVAAAWPVFLQSCKALASRPQWTLWRPACEDAKALVARDARALRAFFEAHFEPYQLTNPDGSTSGMITGYYEPLLRGSRTRTATFNQPVYGVPPDLLTIDLGSVLPDLKNMRLRGRLQGNKIVPYYSRAEIESREAIHPEHALLWVDDAVELFFLQVQGSGRVKLPNGQTVRLAYADQNGHPYLSIGRVLVEWGEMTAEQASLQGIQAWARQNPARLDKLLNSNPSYVFFREQALKVGAEEGPSGSLGVPLTAGRSLAVDTSNVPLGAPVFLATTRPDNAAPIRRLMLAQDTGGAIRGAVRADYFWGFGADAGGMAGRMRQQGRMWVLLPPGAAPK